MAYMTDEAVEGRDTFLQKRDPDWTSFPRLLLAIRRGFALTALITPKSQRAEAGLAVR